MTQLNMLQNNDDKGIAPLLNLGKDRKKCKIYFYSFFSQSLWISSAERKSCELEQYRLCESWTLTLSSKKGKFVSMISLRFIWSFQKLIKKHVQFPWYLRLRLIVSYFSISCFFVFCALVCTHVCQPSSCLHLYYVALRCWWWWWCWWLRWW